MSTSSIPLVCVTPLVVLLAIVKLDAEILVDAPGDEGSALALVVHPLSRPLAPLSKSSKLQTDMGNLQLH